MCSSCATLNGVPVKYTEKGSKPIVPICGTCVNKEHCAVAGCNRYEKQLKQTNADRVRNMTDEGMFDLFTEDMDGERFFYCPACRGKTEEECFASNCADCFMAWLKQEVSDA